MFDLEKAIADWRRQMLAGGIQSPVPLEELEIHLREEIAQQMKVGADAECALANAVKKMGQAGLLKSEFQKTSAPTLERITALVAGIPTVLVGLFLVRVVVGQSWKLNDDAVFSGGFVLAFGLALTLILLGIILTCFGGGKVPWLPNSRAKQKYV
jgi:hypothetical protein